MAEQLEDVAEVIRLDREESSLSPEDINDESSLIDITTVSSRYF